MSMQKQDDPFGHASMVRSNSAALTLQDKPLTRPERHSVIEFRQQAHVIEMEGIKTEIGQAIIAGVHLTSGVHFTGLVSNLDTINQSCQGSKWAKDMIGKYNDGNAQQGGAYINIATRAGSERVIAVINDSIYKPTKEEEPGIARRFEEWLFGT